MYSKTLIHGKALSIATQRLHTKCRNSTYPLDPLINRFPVPDDKVSWDHQYPEYEPISYTHPSVWKAPWADMDFQIDKTYPVKYNAIDNGVDRTSYPNPYQLGINGLPLNPCGRTGIQGRGSLGRWGPNHAADPIVTRWKRDFNKEKIIDPVTGCFVLQFVAIRRRDTHEWAIPGGMVDVGESVSETLRREFSEEALCSVGAFGAALDEIREQVHKAFKSGVEIYRGYVDDPRNTDNAWMETVAVNFHDDQGSGLAKFKLVAGDDAVAAAWVDIDSSLKLYASHREFVALTAKLHNASWLENA